MKNIHVFLAVLVLFFISSAGMVLDSESQEPWTIPTKYKKMENPTDPGDREGIAIGKQLYTKHCKSCHGKTGLGDGTKASELETSCGDFSTAEFQGQSDGVLYYKSIIGRDEMPNFEKKIPEEEDRWLVINYMKTFAK
jgi:mono/diheme cytochrome c family protein